MMNLYWDERFFFPAWDTQLIERLLAQQEDLKRLGVERHVCILMDDVILDKKGDDALAHMGMRGRHFNISCITCSVSYTTLPKRFRRSLDCLLVFSLPMTGDLQVLTWEFTQKAQMARWALANLDEHQCLVLETLQRRQALFVWRAEEVTVANLTGTGDEPGSGSPETGGRSDAPEQAEEAGGARARSASSCSSGSAGPGPGTAGVPGAGREQ